MSIAPHAPTGNGCRPSVGITTLPCTPSISSLPGSGMTVNIYSHGGIPAHTHEIAEVNGLTEAMTHPEVPNLVVLFENALA